LRDFQSGLTRILSCLDWKKKAPVARPGLWCGSWGAEGGECGDPHVCSTSLLTFCSLIGAILGSRTCGSRRKVVAPLVGHDDAPSIAVPLLESGRYCFGLAPSGTIVGQDLASIVRDKLAFGATFKMEKIPPHGRRSKTHRLRRLIAAASRLFQVRARPRRTCWGVGRRDQEP
jgi:hypothetical protein